MVDVAKLMRRHGVTIAELAAEMQITQKRVRSFREDFHRTLRPGQSAFQTWRDLSEACQHLAQRKAQSQSVGY